MGGSGSRSESVQIITDPEHCYLRLCNTRKVNAGNTNAHSRLVFYRPNACGCILSEPNNVGTHIAEVWLPYACTAGTATCPARQSELQHQLRCATSAQTPVQCL
jgi:hypothetical protein